MFMRVLAPRRPQPAPVAGTSLSVVAHAALLLATATSGNGRGASPDAAARAAASAGERLHWVGVAAGDGTRAAGRPGALPPVAYVIPGRGGVRIVASAGGPRADARGRRARAGEATREERRAAELAVARRLPRAVRLAPLPDVALPDPEATLLVAGALASAPDLARRAARPEDFAPATTLLADLLVRSGTVAAGVMRTDLNLRALPIPFVSNPSPRYPAVLERARVGGHVVVEFRVDSTGVVDAGSLQVVQSSDARFTDAVRSVLPQLRFVPAQQGERSVGVTVRQPFVFTVRAGR
jgi:TonB family protein